MRPGGGWRYLMSQSKVQNRTLEMEITNLRCGAASNEGTRQGQNATASPISQLPIELLVEIIERTLPPVEFTLGQLALSAFAYVRKLYTIRLVAKQWQGIIDTTPTLWTYVVSTLPPHVNEATIRRSGTGPLVIVFSFLRSGSGGRIINPIRLVEDFLRSVAHTFPRWSAYCGPLVRGYFEKPAPHLRTIILTLLSRPTWPLKLLGGNATNLRHVYLSQVSIAWKTGLFAQLKVLKLNNAGEVGLTTTHLFDILHASLCLEHLEFDRVSATADHPQSLQAITLPALRLLHIGHCKQDFSGTILRQIRAPSCIEFRLDLTPIGSRSDVLAFLNEDVHPFQEFLGVAHRRNGSSEITLNSEHFKWASSGRDGVQRPLLFCVDIRGRSLEVGIQWAESILQGDPDVSIRFGNGSYLFVQIEDAIAPMRSVTRMELQDFEDKYDLLFTLELMGRGLRKDRSIPSLPCLRELVLPNAKWKAKDLLTMVHSRFKSRSWEDTSRTPLTINIHRESVPGDDPRTILDLTTLMKIREIEGVERVQFAGSEELDGTLAITWDEQTSNPVYG